MPRREKPLIPEFNPDLCDPHQSYTLRTHNQKLTADFGNIAPVRVQNGYAEIYALPDDADEEVIAERRDLLEFFQNAHKAEVPIRVFDEEKGLLTVQGYKLEPSYVIEIKREKPASAKPLKAAS